jgi:hypothetical protein
MCRFLVENRHIQSMQKYHEEYLTIHSKDVYRRMQDGDPTWVHDVPPGVALLICQSHMLGYDPEKAETGA